MFEVLNPLPGENKENQSAIIGKTYSLYGSEASPANFYKQLTSSSELILERFNDKPVELLSLITKAGTSGKKIRSYEKKDQFFSFMINILRRDLKKYLVDVEGHLRSISFRQKWDEALSTSEDQYLLYMFEIELTNRIYLRKFSSCSKKLAFLPHCIRDFSRDCLSSPDEIDHLCQGCSKICSINKINRYLKQNEVFPYIWLKADLQKIFSRHTDQPGTLGVIGIACIPELAKGMRLCRKYNIPVVGVSLDANRCRRWMGEFYKNSVNLEQLEKLCT
jgi:hypothetical protein